MIRRILDFIRSLKKDAEKAPDTLYREGYIDALDVVEEFIEDEFDD